MADGTSPPELGDPDRDYLPSARPGARAPHLPIERNGETLSTLDLFDGRFTLVAGQSHAEDWRRAAAGVDVPLEVVAIDIDAHDPSGRWASLYGIEAGAVLVRPDGHVAWRTRHYVEDPDAALRETLTRILGNGQEGGR